jgi:hypothetical protein
MMAYGDYQHCAVCDAKTFYDANIDWESQNVCLDDYGAPESVVSLCSDCSKTHKIVVQAK